MNTPVNSYPGEATLSVGTRAELYEITTEYFCPKHYKTGTVYPAHGRLVNMVWLQGNDSFLIPFVVGLEVKQVGAITIKSVK
ncbi:hypothetical protein [Sphingobacterium mizutaii]|uniref:hypothetical protein n=1 Tax=Sphingobacterium mizutaii TaxID=1010 RepID=UPI0028A29A34|nr:hypothetical protein [Sphingobacterium mizutaii]